MSTANELFYLVSFHGVSTVVIPARVRSVGMSLHGLMCLEQPPTLKKNRVRHLACDPVHQMPVISKVLQYHIHPPCIARLYSAYSAIILYMSILFILMNCLEQVYNALSYIPSALNLLQCRRVPQLAQAPSTHAPKVCENNMDKVCWTKSVGQLYLCDQSVTMGRVSEGNDNVESLLACISYTPFVHHGTIIWVPTKHKIITFIQWRLQHVYHSAKPIWTLEWNDLTLATLLLTFGPQSPPFYIFYIILLHYPRISSCCFPSEPERHLDLPWAIGDHGSVIWLWYVGAVWYVICEFEWIWHYWVTVAN